LLLLTQQPHTGLGPHQGRFERLFDADFGAVAIHRSSFGDALCEHLDARAFALGEHIAVRRAESDLSSPRGQALLAHELAHVVQQRRGKVRSASVATTVELEREADLAAQAVVAGRAFRCRLADSAGLPRAWDYAGHYFTTYLVFLNAGCSNDEARAMATCCWAPDQVCELDAATVGTNDYNLAFPIPLIKALPDSGAAKRGNINTYREGYEAFARRQFRNHEQYVQVIHKGLHCLTGADAANERRRREAIFRGMIGKGSILKHGLALHSFGDAFAHQRIGSTSLYSPGVGHASDGDDPDEPWRENRGGVYIDYVRTLVGLAGEYTGRPPRVAADDLLMALSPMLQGPDVAARLGSFSDWEAGARRRMRAHIVRPITELRKETVARSEVGCGRHIAKVASALLDGEQIAVHDRIPADRWSSFFSRNRSLLTSSARPKYRGNPSSAFGPEHIVFFEIVESALEWSQPREFLEPVFIETAQGDVQIDGPRRLRKDQSATYRVRLIGLPPAGRISWSPAVGETKGGLRGAGATSDGSFSVVATESHGKGIIAAMCEWNEASKYSPKYGRAEIELLQAP
jgi:hypothetical protein